MMEEHVYLLWDCDQCGRKGIPCSPDHRYCPECEHPRTFPEFDNAYLPGDNESWDDHDHHFMPDEVFDRLRKAGASWFCVVCYSDNYGDESKCHHCGTKRGATDQELRDDTTYESFVQYMDNDQGASADLVEVYGEYAGMRAAHGESFKMDDDHEGQLERANAGRSAFQSEMDSDHESRPDWEDSDLPSSIESEMKHDIRSKVRPKIDVPPIKTQTRDEGDYFRVALILGVLSLVGLVGFLIWGFSSKEVQGKVKALNWTREIQEQRWTNVRRSGWKMNLTERPETPPTQGKGERAGLQILSCSLKHHHYEEYQCGTKQVSCTHMESYQETYSCTKHRSESYSCTKTKRESYSCGTYSCRCQTRRNSNGTASRSCSTCTKTCYRTVNVNSTCTKSVPYQTTCTRTKQRPMHDSDTVPKYCERSIEKSHCDYETQAWVNSDYYVLRGTEKPAKWPDGSLGPRERASRSERYEALLSYPDGGSEAKVKKKITRDEFEALNVGDKILFDLTNFGTVKNIHLGSGR